MANNTGQPSAVSAFVEIANETIDGPVQVVLSPKYSTVAEHANFLLGKIIESQGQLLGLHLYGPVELAAIFKDNAALVDHDVPLEANSTYTFHFKPAAGSSRPLVDGPNAFYELGEMDMEEMAIQMAEFADMEENEQMTEFANSINAPIVANLSEHYDRAKLIQLIQFGNDIMPSLYVQQNQSLNEKHLVGNIVYLLLFKSHAVLMLFAWLFFAPLAILFARFQRDPLRRLLGEQLWFQVHRLSNTFTVVLTLLAFVCIFSALGGNWAGPTVGDSSVACMDIHCLFGLIAVLLALSQPISALFRCHPDSSSRQIFNILHASSGYLGWFCATVAITIACLNYRGFASPTAAAVLIFIYLALLVVCIGLMQFLAIQKAQLQIGIGQAHLFAAAALICTATSVTIALLVIFG